MLRIGGECMEMVLGWPFACVAVRIWWWKYVCLVCSVVCGRFGGSGACVAGGQRDEKNGNFRSFWRCSKCCESVGDAWKWC